MIHGFEDETAALTPKERLLVGDFIKGMTGRSKKDIVTADEIIRRMRGKGIRLSGPRVRKIINYIRAHGLVKNLVATSKGYYVETDQEELKKYVGGLVERAQAILQVANSFGFGHYIIDKP